MVYLISKFPCTISNFKIFPAAKYELTDIDENLVVFPTDGTIPFSLDLKDKILPKNVNVMEHYGDKYIFLNHIPTPLISLNRFTYSGMEVCVVISNEINISTNGETILEREVCGIKYSHYELFSDFAVIYFLGERNFVIIMQGKNIKCADYYDEINIEKDELYFLTYMHDSLNHGKVRSIKNKTFDEYLVKIEEVDKKIDFRLVHIVFLECLQCGNYEFCNSLLNEDIKQVDAKNISSFFPVFDDFYPINQNVVGLFNKNALVGKFKFDAHEGKIENIIELN